MCIDRVSVYVEKGVHLGKRLCKRRLVDALQVVPVLQAFRCAIEQNKCQTTDRQSEASVLIGCGSAYILHSLLYQVHAICEVDGNVQSSWSNIISLTFSHLIEMQRNTSSETQAQSSLLDTYPL